MKTHTVELPNGFLDLENKPVTHVEFRELTGKEENLMYDQDNLRDGDVLNKVMKSVIVAMGPHKDPTMIANLYDQHMLLEDMMYLLIAVRRFGVGDIYSFAMMCPKCNKEGRHRIDLSTLVIDLPKPEDRFQRSFVTVIDHKGTPVPVEFRPLLVGDEPLIREIRSKYQKTRATSELLVNVTKIGGEAPSHKSLEDTPSQLLTKIRNYMDTKTGGIDLELLVTCANGTCRSAFKAVTPIDFRPFFFPAEDGTEISKAIPFRNSGPTLTPLGAPSDGVPPKSETSPSRSESPT